MHSGLAIGLSNAWEIHVMCLVTGRPMQQELEYPVIEQGVEVHVPFDSNARLLKRVPLQHYMYKGATRLCYVNGDMAHFVESPFNMYSAHRSYKIFGDLIVSKGSYTLYKFYIEPNIDRINHTKRELGMIPPRAHIERMPLTIDQVLQRKTVKMSSTVASLVELIARAPKPLMVSLLPSMEGVLDLLPKTLTVMVCRTITDEQNLSRRRRLKVPEVLITFVEHDGQNEAAKAARDILAEPGALPRDGMTFYSSTTKSVSASKIRPVMPPTNMIPALYLLPWACQICVNNSAESKLSELHLYSVFTSGNVRTRMLIDDVECPSCTVEEHALDCEEIEGLDMFASYSKLSNRLAMGSVPMVKRVSMEEFIEQGAQSRLRDIDYWRAMRDLAFLAERKCKQRILEAVANASTRSIQEEDEFTSEFEEESEAEEVEAESEAEEESKESEAEEEDAEEESGVDDVEEESKESEAEEGSEAEIAETVILDDGASDMSRLNLYIYNGAEISLTPEESHGISHKYQDYQIRDMDRALICIVDYEEEDLDGSWYNMLKFKRRGEEPRPIYPDIDLNLPDSINEEDFLNLDEYPQIRRYYKRDYTRVIAHLKEFDQNIRNAIKFWDVIEKLDVGDVFEGAERMCPICLTDTVCLISSCRHFICPECYADKPNKSLCGSCKRTKIKFFTTQPIKPNEYVNCIKSIIAKASGEVMIIRQYDEVRTMLKTILDVPVLDIDNGMHFPKDMKGKLLMAKHPNSIPSCVSDVIVSLPYCICPKFKEGTSCLCSVHPVNYRRLQELPGVTYHVIYHKDTIEESAWELVNATV